MEKPKYKPEQMLMMAMRFTEDDLESNRRGLLSEAQRARFRRNRTQLQWLTAVALIGLVVSPMLCASAMFYGANVGLFEAASIIIVFAVMTLLVSGKRLGTWRNDLFAGKAAALEGRVNLDVGTSQYGSHYKVTVEGQAFGVRKDVFLAFKNGDPYRIYYAPQSKTLLSAEWLRDESPQELSDGKAKI